MLLESEKNHLRCKDALKDALLVSSQLEWYVQFWTKHLEIDLVHLESIRKNTIVPEN